MWADEWNLNAKTGVKWRREGYPLRPYPEYSRAHHTLGALFPRGGPVQDSVVTYLALEPGGAARGSTSPSTLAAPGFGIWHTRESLADVEREGERGFSARERGHSISISNALLTLTGVIGISNLELGPRIRWAHLNRRFIVAIIQRDFG